MTEPIDPDDLDALDDLWRECLRLVGEPGSGITGHSSNYYKAQSRAMNAAFEALPTLVAELRAARKVVEADTEVRSFVQFVFAGTDHLDDPAVQKWLAALADYEASQK